MWRRQFGYRRGVLGGGDGSCWCVSETTQRERERERERDIQGLPAGPSEALLGCSVRLPKTTKTHCMGTDGFPDCLRRSSEGCCARFTIRGLYPEHFFGGCAGLFDVVEVVRVSRDAWS
jgi:hypothetical protein